MQSISPAQTPSTPAQPAALAPCPAPQQQVWQPSAAATPPTVVKEEFLQCPNCGVKISQTPGIPWVGAVCPGCKTVMAHVIREKETAAAVPAPAAVAQPVLNPLGVPTLPDGAPQPPRKWWELFPPVGADPHENPFNLAQPQALQQQPAAMGQQGSNDVGAGVIISKRGYILTSYHLVDQPNLVVTLFTPQGPQTFPGTVVAVLPANNLAVVQIKPGMPIDLPVAPIGNSDALNIGDTVLAFGNPFGLSQTVTSGIVSAKRKSVTIQGQTYQDLIQTDAPINQGNAGGPLVNVKGEVVGISAAIYSPMQTNTGLGFAVPTKQLYPDLAGYVDAPAQGQAASMQLAAGAPPTTTRLGAAAPTGVQEPSIWVGVELQDLNKAMANQLKVPVNVGLLINMVYPNSPAAVAGMQRGDVLYRVDGRRIVAMTDLQASLKGKKSGDVLHFDVFRNGTRIPMDVELAPGSLRQAALAVTAKKETLLAGSEIEAGTADIVSLGLTIDKITPDVAFAFSLPEGTTGVVIAAVEGLSAVRGVQAGDVIRSVDGQKTPDLLTFYKALEKGDLTKGVNLGVMRKGKPVEIFIKENPVNLPQGI